jgi:hypothetical protein
MHMAFHIKTTLNIDDTVMASLREEATRRGTTCRLASNIGQHWRQGLSLMET